LSYPVDQFPPPVDYAPAPVKKSRLLPALLSTGLVLTVIVAGSIVAFLQRDNIRDLITVWNYEPTPAILGYIDRAELSERGEFLFKASQPQIAATDEEFNDTCGSLEEGTGVLGCYLPSPRTILLFDVTDDRLDGVEEVVAAHEMLHAAWDRMGADEKSEIGALLEAVAADYADDEAFTARMEVYARAEPGERINELHSILATEIDELSPALEEHYAEYFDDRAAVVALHVASEKVLREIEQRTNELVDELDAINEKNISDYAKYNAGYDKLNADIDAFNAKNNAYGFTSQAEFDAERNALIARDNSLKALFATIEKRQDTYATKLAELEELNAQVADLNEGLNIVPRDSEL
jgi:hypothetical protein